MSDTRSKREILGTVVLVAAVTYTSIVVAEAVTDSVAPRIVRICRKVKNAMHSEN